MNLCCFPLTEGTSLLFHVSVQLALKTIQPSNHSVHIVVYVALRDVLLGDFLACAVQQNLNTFDLFRMTLDHPQNDGREEGEDYVPYQQFHAFNDKAFLVGLPFSSFIGPGIPDILAQKERRLPASFSVFGCGAGGFSPGFPGFAAL